MASPSSCYCSSTQGCRGRGGLALLLLVAGPAGAASSSTQDCRGLGGLALLLLLLLGDRAASSSTQGCRSRGGLHRSAATITGSAHLQPSLGHHSLQPHPSARGVGNLRRSSPRSRAALRRVRYKSTSGCT
ncbi:hypothetical protein C2845_PM03G30290 [Panicum miliaceum]|uniref:Uncharacterized protein n=1 Tax=Panicum miliaceum TaxID=4540 RepID=A0A3L6TF41_PANMI|nr:hypothetical protein C2845_PM03G30290 [Panicum miliaceum]